MAHELPKLPYAMDALAPKISSETLEYHHGKHHRAYVDKLNELVVGTKYAAMTLEDIIRDNTPGPVFNNAAQAWNHTFYFLAFSPAPKKQPSGALAEAIDAAFGSFEAMRDAMLKAGAGQFGSGWVWLVAGSGGRLEVVATANAANPMTGGQKPLATLDVWEHAYYIDYRNRRPDHLAAAFELIDWATVERRFDDAK
jgi:Fe-Mn family superoxide dismutase